jgi:hypothetical protein
VGAGAGGNGEDWRALVLDPDSDAARLAAEVVVGRADLTELSGLGVPATKAEQVGQRAQRSGQQTCIRGTFTRAYLATRMNPLYGLS